MTEYAEEVEEPMFRQAARPSALFRWVGFLTLVVSMVCLSTTRLNADCGLHCTGLTCWWEQSSNRWFRSSATCRDWWLSTAGCSYPYCDCTGMSAIITITEQNLTKIACPRADPNNVQANGCKNDGSTDKDGGLIRNIRCCVSCVTK
jgi:hypothetical protein